MAEGDEAKTILLYIGSNDKEQCSGAFQKILAKLGQDLKACKEKSANFELYVKAWCKRVEKSLAANQISFYVSECFKVFLDVMDECMFLLLGDIRREHHHKKFKRYIRSRGHEDKYYKGKGCVVCSIDGLNLEYRKAGKRLNSKMKDSVPMAIDLLKSDIERARDACREGMETVLDHLKNIGPRSKIKVKYEHFEEEVKIDFISIDNPDVKFQLELSRKNTVFPKDEGDIPVLPGEPPAPKKPIHKASKPQRDNDDADLFSDEDDMPISLNEIKRKTGCDPTLLEESHVRLSEEMVLHPQDAGEVYLSESECEEEDNDEDDDDFVNPAINSRLPLRPVHEPLKKKRKVASKATSQNYDGNASVPPVVTEKIIEDFKLCLGFDRENVLSELREVFNESEDRANIEAWLKGFDFDLNWLLRTGISDVVSTTKTAIHTISVCALVNTITEDLWRRTNFLPMVPLGISVCNTNGASMDNDPYFKKPITQTDNEVAVLSYRYSLQDTIVISSDILKAGEYIFSLVLDTTNASTKAKFLQTLGVDSLKLLSPGLIRTFLGLIDDCLCPPSSGSSVTPVTIRLIDPAVDLEEVNIILSRAFEQVYILCGVRTLSLQVTVDCSGQPLSRHLMRTLLQIDWFDRIYASCCGISSRSMTSKLWNLPSLGRASEISMPFNYFLLGFVTTQFVVKDMSLFDALLCHLMEPSPATPVTITIHGIQIDTSKVNIWFQFVRFMFSNPQLTLFDCSNCVSGNSSSALVELMGLCAGVLIAHRMRLHAGLQPMRRILILNNLRPSSLSTELELRVKRELCTSTESPPWDFFL